eukprot:7160321-Pyramimonas_sp.AAC.1
MVELGLLIWIALGVVSPCQWHWIMRRASARCDSQPRPRFCTDDFRSDVVSECSKAGGDRKAIHLQRAQRT